CVVCVCVCVRVCVRGRRRETSYALASAGAGRILFVNSKVFADELCEKLYEGGIYCDTLHGGRPQEKRLLVLDQFRKGRTQLLIATDVMGRGLDVEGVTHVVVFEMGGVEDGLHTPHRPHRPGQERQGARPGLLRVLRQAPGLGERAHRGVGEVRAARAARAHQDRRGRGRRQARLVDQLELRRLLGRPWRLEERRLGRPRRRLGREQEHLLGADRHGQGRRAVRCLGRDGRQVAPGRGVSFLRGALGEQRAAREPPFSAAGPLLLLLLHPSAHPPPPLAPDLRQSRGLHPSLARAGRSVAVPGARRPL
ncbi:unnamed protein product, partial [Prorocentrum cordatum]